ncbi:MAG: DUF3127 domain-containing protein [Alloprevotella sp.]|nr:DUF3127 domain-containing protein [Alloprevotella sp.]
MDITGKIITALEPRSGTSARSGQEWKSQEFVIEWMENQYPRHCCFRVFGADRLAQLNLQVGQEYTVSLDIDAHEYNGRWFNDINCWRAIAPQAGAPAPAPAATQAAPAPTAPAPTASEIPSPQQPAATDGGAEDDLPF